MICAIRPRTAPAEITLRSAAPHGAAQSKPTTPLKNGRRLDIFPSPIDRATAPQYAALPVVWYRCEAADRRHSETPMISRRALGAGLAFGAAAVAPPRAQAH